MTNREWLNNLSDEELVENNLNTEYQGLEPDREYTLEELGI